MSDGDRLGDAVRLICEKLASAFAVGRFDDVTRYFNYPLVVYLPTGMRMDMTPEDTIDAIFQRRGAAKSAGMTDVKVTIHDIGENREGRIPVHLVWNFTNKSGESVGKSEMRYFCRVMPNGAVRIELMEILTMAFPNLPKVWAKHGPAH